MHDLPPQWSALCAAVVLLGMRHGLDADHLAAIDGMTRINHGARRGLARGCGVLFALGHGIVVLSMAGMVAVLSGRWSPPEWLDVTGGWISVGFLAGLGLANLQAALRAPPGTVVRPIGLRGAFLGRFLHVRSASAAAAVGALFAVSFDTLGQAALMAVAGASFGGWPNALSLAGLFVLGMLLVDGLNGWWIAHLVSRADRLAARASRVMAFAVAAFSLLVAALGAVKLLSPGFDRWQVGGTLWLAVGVALAVAAIAAACLAARFGRRRESAPG